MTKTGKIPPAPRGAGPADAGLRRVAGAQNGALWLTAMPGRAAPFEDWQRAAAEAGIDHLLCLCEPAEIAARSPDYAQARATGGLCLARTDYPVADFGVPADSAAFTMLVARAAAWLKAGSSVAIHCNAGIGRTGLAAICVLIAGGLAPEAAEAAVRAAGSGPETEAQKAFCRSFAAAHAVRPEG